jgi:hypothetical protein
LLNEVCFISWMFSLSFSLFVILALGRSTDPRCL